MKREREEKIHKTIRSSTRLRHSVAIDIPLDLTVEILKKLPTKSLVRFQCVSKLWSSIISSRRDFIDSIVTRYPCNDAHLIFGYVSNHSTECFLPLSSSTCPPNTDKVSVLTIPGKLLHYVRGLMFCWSDNTKEATIYNPTTRKCFPLPKMETSHMGTYFFGYDPFKNQYKVVFLPRYSMEKACTVFTLGDPAAQGWRNIQGVGSNFPLCGAICFNGAIYYQASYKKYDDSACAYKLMSFDVRSEEFHDVDAPRTLMDHVSTLINYQGKLGFVCCQKGMEIWVREDGDLKTQGWSKLFFYEMDGLQKWRITGATRGGDILFVRSKYLSVIYFDPKRNSMRYVDVPETYLEERSDHNIVLMGTLPDYVENTMRLV